MKIGLIGLPNSGKTTIFNALSRSEAEVTSFANTRAEPNLAVVDVQDDRVDRLSAIYSPKKTVRATVELVDFVGLSEGSAREGLFSGEAMTMVRNSDALAVVVRRFYDALADPPTPVQDVAEIEDELIISDMIVAEKRLERIEWSKKRGLQDNEAKVEEQVLRRMMEHMESGLPLRRMTLSAEEVRVVRGFQFISQKPLIVILNADEETYGKNNSLVEHLREHHTVIEFAGNFEMELARMDPEEAATFMEDLGISDSARARLTRLAYETVGNICFFTVGEDEVRAWNIILGQSALEAAGVIHSDLARGFIRAECFSYDDLIEGGSEKAVKEKGRFRLEGKTYPVQDGDILSIRFSV
jgi:GTP-binding protein YchF